MKSILDRSFTYRPSFSTDLRKTFAKARREQRVDALTTLLKNMEVSPPPEIEAVLKEHHARP